MPQRIDYPDGLKACVRCQVTKPLTDFYAVKGRGGQPTGRCKACVAELRPPYQRKVPIEPRKCEHCGTVFSAGRAKYCSRKCAQTAWIRGQGVRPIRRIAIVDGRKQCTRCSEWKPLDSFGRRTDRKHAPLSECKQCASKRMCDYVRGDRGRNNRYAKKYGVSIEWYEGTLATQGGVCAICGSPPDSGSKMHPRLAIDHDHRSGRPRGLLCFICNSALGKFRDDPELLRRAVAYLELSARRVVGPG